MAETDGDKQQVSPRNIRRYRGDDASASFPNVSALEKFEETAMPPGTQSTSILLERLRQVTINRTLNCIHMLYAVKIIISSLIGLTETKTYRKSKVHQ